MRLRLPSRLHQAPLPPLLLLLPPLPALLPPAAVAIAVVAAVNTSAVKASTVCSTAHRPLSVAE
jgi:hypothetical protein